MKTHLILISILSAATLAACSTTTETAQDAAELMDDPRLGEKVSSVCFARNIDGFRMNNRDSVVLTKGIGDDYLVTVMGVCSNLDFAQTVGIDTTTSCITQGDELIISNTIGAATGPFDVQRCLIRDIYKWDEDAGEATETKPGS
jgi:acetate kinase